MTNKMGSKQIDKILCIACHELIGRHSKNALARCLFRIQGTMIAEGKSNVDNNIKADFVKQNYVDKMLDQAYYENQMDGQKV